MRLTIILLIVVLFSCSKDNSNSQGSSTNYLMFGHFHGMCIGEQCIEIFKLDETILLEDQNDKYPSYDKFYEGLYRIKTDAFFQKAKVLKTQFPMDLLNEPNITIGNPDVVDQGGYYIEYNYGGTRKFWMIDKSLNNVPSKYHSFLNSVEQTIETLK